MAKKINIVEDDVVKYSDIKTINGEEILGSGNVVIGDSENINRIPSATYLELGITPESTSEEKLQAISTFLEGYNNLATDNLFFEIKEDVPEIEYNFDITANWETGDSNYPVTNQASFETFLANRVYNEVSNLTNINITDFSLINGRLKCNLTANGTTIDFGEMNITEVISLGNLPQVTFISFGNNTNLSVADGIINTLPPNSTLLRLNKTAITTITPTKSLPLSVNNIVLSHCYSISNWTIMEPFAQSLHTVSWGMIQCYGVSASTDGTNFKSIVESKGWTVNS